MNLLIEKLQDTTEFLTKKDCVESEYNSDGRIMVLRVDEFNPEYRQPIYQLWKVTQSTGFQWDKNSTSVWGTCLADGENAKFHVNRVIGLLSNEKMYELGVCPKCLQNELDTNLVMNSLSRKDNDTYICNDCGVSEAMEELANLG